ncbi:MAG: A24 family peptidase [Deltaproteobacteria bacterium]|nr:A24 family peptidase [Deltaproteobacteria bacterium]
MTTAVTIAAGLALCVSATAAFCDWRRGEIPNWLTLPVLVLAPVSYGIAFGIEYALHSLAAGLLGGLVPYLLFRRGAMGGGDVKLFGALGALMGFDLLFGVELQLAACVAALVAASGALVWKGVLVSTLTNAVVVALRPVLPRRWHREPCNMLAVPIHMGAPVFAATLLFAAPHLLLAWVAP